MAVVIKPGDRVQTTTAAYRWGYWPGEKGTIVFIRQPASIGDVAVYAVRMDSAAGRIAFFATDEIEPDA